MQFDADEFDEQQFDPETATEEECWAAIPHLEGSRKANTLNHLGGLAFERNDFVKASLLANQAAAEWQRFGHDDEAAKCYSNAGSCLRNAGELEQALDFYATAASIASQAGNEEFYSTTNHILGCIHNDLYDREKALEFFLVSLRAAENAESEELMKHAYEGVGVSYLSLGHPEMALDFFQKGYELCSKNGNIKFAAALRTFIGHCYRMMNRPDLAVDEINAARELAVLMKDQTQACDRGNILSALHRELGNFELAIEIADSVKKLAVQERFPKLAATASANIGHAMNRLGQHDSAYELLTTSAEVLKMGGDFSAAVLAEADAAHAALGLGNVALAQLRLAGCEKSAQKINLAECGRESDLNDPHSMLSLVQLQLELEVQLAADTGKPFSLENKSMSALFCLENKAVYLENQDIVNSIMVLKPEFIVAAGIPEITSPEGELLTKTLAELIDEGFFVNDPTRLARFHELQSLVRKDMREATENLSLAITYYLDAMDIGKATELSSRLQMELASRSEISRARAINSRIY
jgi:tetratricopeptide (TPR) repeat protein